MLHCSLKSGGTWLLTHSGTYWSESRKHTSNVENVLTTYHMVNSAGTKHLSFIITQPSPE